MIYHNLFHSQQNRPPNMKKDTIQSRNRKPGRKNTKKKVELDQMAAAGVSGARYPDHMISLQQQLPNHMLHPGQVSRQLISHLLQGFWSSLVPSYRSICSPPFSRCFNFTLLTDSCFDLPCKNLETLTLVSRRYYRVSQKTWWRHCTRPPWSNRSSSTATTWATTTWCHPLPPSHRWPWRTPTRSPSTRYPRTPSPPTPPSTPCHLTPLPKILQSSSVSVW